MRGKVPIGAWLWQMDRITPAHAGKSRLKRPSDNASQDHPRPCGEKMSAYRSSKICVGSPPPMRGKGGLGSAGTLVPRITPAHAGKSRGRLLSTLFAEDHPRPCGEKQSALSTRPSTLGSPPPMRGKDGQCRLQNTNVRITPAHAGKRP